MNTLKGLAIGAALFAVWCGIASVSPNQNPVLGLLIALPFALGAALIWALVKNPEGVKDMAKALGMIAAIIGVVVWIVATWQPGVAVHIVH